MHRHLERQDQRKPAVNRRRDIFVAFCMAVAFHGVAVMCAAALYGRCSSAVAPLFQAGESSVELTVMPSGPDAELAAPLKSPEAVKFDELLPEDEVQVVEPDNAPSDRPAAVDPVNSDADNLPKGVESSNVALSGISPYYPSKSRLLGEEGLVKIRALVAAGRAEHAEILSTSGYPRLDRVALHAVQKARFVNSSGSSGPVETTVSIRFKLTD
jgi:TonB family protein